MGLLGQLCDVIGKRDRLGKRPVGKFAAAPMRRSAPAALSGLCPVTEHLYLSNFRAAEDSCQLIRCNITCVINVSESKSRTPHLPSVEYFHIPVPDTPLAPLSEHFDQVADKIQLGAARGGRTLVHCKAGVSRSAALCMAYLMKHRDVCLLEAHRWVKSCRPLARPNTGFWEQLIRYEMELRGDSSVSMVSSSMGDIPSVYEQEAKDMTPL